MFWLRRRRSWANSSSRVFGSRCNWVFGRRYWVVLTMLKWKQDTHLLFCFFFNFDLLWSPYSIVAKATPNIKESFAVALYHVTHIMTMGVCAIIDVHAARIHDLPSSLAPAVARTEQNFFAVVVVVVTTMRYQGGGTGGRRIHIVFVILIIVFWSFGYLDGGQCRRDG